MEGRLARPALRGARPLTRRSARRAAALLCAALAAAPAAALDREVETQTFTIPYFTTSDGRLVRDMTIAWESYGRLDFRGGNAVLVLPDMHAGPHIAGRNAAGAAPAAWDDLIGRGRALDTASIFVLSVGAPCGPHPAATGPASVDPESGAPWGDRFPALVVGDLVAVQKALSESLGINRIRAVVGKGFGGLLAREWHRRYPHLVERVLAVGPAPAAAADDASCQAEILRRHGGGEDASWLAGDAGSLERALTNLPAE